MQVGDLVRLNNVGGGSLFDLFGVILVIEAKMVRVTWTDGDLTWEFGNHLEVINEK